MMSFQTTPYVNPYIAGNPVHGDFSFFGRADILRQVEQILESPGQNALILYGQRRIGKTSILLQLEHNLPANRYKVIYQDLQDRARLPMSDFLAELAVEIADHLNLDEPNLTFDDQGKVFQKEFLPQVYAALSDADQRLVLLFDEFDVLNQIQQDRLAETAATKQFFPTLRRWLREEPRLAFVFALGRNLDDLDSSDFLSTFKSSQTVSVSIFSREETIELITAPDHLHYTPEAVEYIYALTNGHPYFTQLLCSLCFDRAYKFPSPSPSTPIITVTDIEALLPTFLSRGDNVFAWIWDGLPPVERIVASALAELLTDDKTLATEVEIEAALRHEGIRVIIRDLQVSPKMLVEWGLLQPGKSGYRFLVPVLHRWIRQYKPLANARDEIDKIDPRAHRYYLMAKDEFLNKELQAAATNLQRALALNPNHLQAQILLGDVSLEQNKLEEALIIYERVYQQDKKQVETKLLDVLVQNANNLIKKKKALEAVKVLQQILNIKPGRLDAQKSQSNLLLGLYKKAEGLALEKPFEALELYQHLSEIKPDQSTQDTFKLLGLLSQKADSQKSKNSLQSVKISLLISELQIEVIKASPKESP